MAIKIDFILVQLALGKEKMSETPVYTTRMSVEAAAEERRKATADAMKELSATIGAALNNPESDQSCDDCDSDGDDALLEQKSQRQNKRARNASATAPAPCYCGNPINSKSLITGLESRLHYLQIQLTNTLVELDDKQLELTSAMEWIKSMRTVNNEIGFLRGAVQRGFTADARYVTSAQREQRLKLFREETSEHAAHCVSAINKIDLDEIKQGLTRVLVAERKKLATLDSNYSYQIMQTRCLEVGQRLTFYSAACFAAFALLYQLWLSSSTASMQSMDG